MIARILLPLHPAIAFGRVVSQAVWLAERFGAHLLLLRVGVAAWDVDDGLGQNQIVTRLTVAGEPVHQIAAAVQTHGIDLIMMATHEKWRAGDGAEGESDFSSFSRHSVVARVIEAAHCPVWVDTGQSMAEAAVRKPLCYLDLGTRSAGTLTQAGSFAAAIGAPLTIGHATFSTEIHAPGGASLSARMWQESFAATATEKFAQLQRQAGSDASLLIENGEPLKVLPRLLARAKADLLIAGHWATSERWGRGEAWNDESGICRMIRHARVPVLVFKSEIPPPVQPDPVPSAGRRLVTNLVILLPTILILVAALTIGVLKTRPAHFSVRQWWNSARGE